MSNCSDAAKMRVECLLTPSEMGTRKDEFRTLAAAHLVETSRTERGASLAFREADGAVEAAVRELVRAERECCPFFELSVTTEGGIVRLEIAAPPQAQAYVDGLLDAMKHGSSPRA